LSVSVAVGNLPEEDADLGGSEEEPVEGQPRRHDDLLGAVADRRQDDG